MVMMTFKHRNFTLDQYRSMFLLTDDDLSLKILDYAAGISTFNAQMYTLGHHSVVSVDRAYELTLSDLQQAVKGNVELSEKGRLQSQLFLDDFSTARASTRYAADSMPSLPFKDTAFDLALCADYSHRPADLSLITMIFELCRIAKEVRLFPLLDATGNIHHELGPVMLALQQSNFGLEIKSNGSGDAAVSGALLRIWSKECLIASASHG